MQLAAQLAAAIEILDDYLAGQPLEKALTNWARRSRFAGSKDRAAIRDTVFDCVRCRKSLAARAGGETGRGLVLAHCFLQVGFDGVTGLFSGQGHAPAGMSDDERAALIVVSPPSWQAQTDIPDWLRSELERSLSGDLDSVCTALKTRAPVFIRVNQSKATRTDVEAELRAAGIATVPHPTVKTALQVTEYPRRLATTEAYTSGRIELQDAHSQAVCAALPSVPKMLDYCAGGGGKTLAYAALNESAIFAHDANPGRLHDLEARAQRGGHTVACLSTKACNANAPFDLVLCDVPCSGSGAWRRSPAGKWSLTLGQLSSLRETQRQILKNAADLLTPNGQLVYVTCSVLDLENMMQINWFVEESPEFTLKESKQYLPSDRGDGFFVACLSRSASAP